MQIFVQILLKESPLRLKVHHTRSVLMSKQILMKAKVKHRAFTMTKGKWLRYGIQETRGPPLVVKLRGCMQTFVRTVTWKYIAMVVDESNTIVDVKTYIQETEGIPVDQQRLVFSAKRLDDERALADYNVHEDCILHLVVLH